ncbi:MAG: efflux transporter periplasmic adaptor subunit [Sphingomonas sp.]|nr:efflux transporter periplasmic adaptor subunit [Sphingomonas sp.]MBX9729971.1 efflux RND transporter periplasmic adaptor subunit [Sphingomonas sp.]
MGCLTRLRFTVGATLLAAASLSACGSAPEASTVKPDPVTGARLKIAASETGDWKAVSAEIATVDQAQAIARIPGILSTLSVRAGDVVRKGQAIGRIVDSQLAPQSAAFGAQAAAAQAQAAQAQADLARVKFLYDNGVYAKARLDQAQAATAAATAQIRAARAQQSAVGAVAGQGTIIAPAAGRVLRADIPAGSAVAPGMVIATITAGETVLRLTLPESLADRVHAGSRVRADGLSGRVMRVYPSVQGGQITADVAMSGIDNSLIGRRIAAEVETGTRPAIIVPQAFVTRAYGIDTVTMLAADGTAASVPVQTTASGEPGKIEILSGVNAGDTLIAAPAK